MANQPTGRNVEVKMKFSADTQQAKGEMAATRREVEKLGTEARKTQQEMKKMGGGSGGTGGGGGGGGPSGAGINPMAVFSRAAAVVMLFTRAMEGAEKATKAYYDNAHLSQGMRGLAAAGSLGNSLTFGAGNAIEEKLTSIYYAKSKSEALNALSIESYRANVIGAGIKRDRSLRALNEDYAATSSEVVGMSDAARRDYEARRTGRMADRANDEDRSGLTEAEIAMRAASRRKARGDEAYVRSRQNVDARQQELADLMKQRDAMPMGGNVFSAEKNAIEWRLKNLEITEKMKEVEQAIVDRKQKGLSLESLTLEASKKSVEARRMELGLLKEKEAKAKSQATDFGMMSGSDKLALKYALQQAETQGVDSLPEETRRLLASSGLTAEYTRKASEKSVQDDPVYQEIVRLTGGKTSSQLGKEVIQLENKIDIEVKDMDEHFAAKVKEKLKEALDDMDKNIREIAKQEITVLLNQRKTFE